MRSVSQRLEGIEDGVDRLDERLAGLQASLDGVAKELGRAAQGGAQAADAQAPAPKSTPKST